MSIFELLMLICFGAAWPVSIYRSWKAKTAKGKSVIFLFILIAGYIFGIINKLLYRPDVVLFFYILNTLMVSTDLAITFRNRRFDLESD